MSATFFSKKEEKSSAVRVEGWGRWVKKGGEGRDKFVRVEREFEGGRLVVTENIERETGWSETKRSE